MYVGRVPCHCVLSTLLLFAVNCDTELPFHLIGQIIHAMCAACYRFGKLIIVCSTTVSLSPMPSPVVLIENTLCVARPFQVIPTKQCNTDVHTTTVV